MHSLDSDVTRNKLAVLDQQERRTSVVNLPFFYHIHLHMPCNQRCIMCVPSGRHPKSTMPFSDFEAFVHRVSPYAEHITLLGGEPFLYPSINEALELLAEFPVAVTINTNGTLLSDNIIGKLLKLHELHLKFSIDAASRDKYLKIRGTDSFDCVIENIERFVDLSADNPAIMPILVFVVMRANLDEVVPFVERFKSSAIHRIEFHPVRHVANWEVENKTGWLFRGTDQICESFQTEYNETMLTAQKLCQDASMDCEVHLFPEGGN